MFGKMRLLVGCRSGMTVKFASKFHHGNPFIRGLVVCWQRNPPLREGVVLFGASAASVACGLLWDAAHSMRVYATPLFLRCSPHGHAKDFPCVAYFAPMHSTYACVTSSRGQCTQRGSRDARRGRRARLLSRRGQCTQRAFAPRPRGSRCAHAHLRSIVHCSPRASRRAKGAGKLHRFARLDSWGYSSTSRHSKRADARFAKRTVYRPPSGELVMVLIR